jgi:hypothetical protein
MLSEHRERKYTAIKKGIAYKNVLPKSFIKSSLTCNSSLINLIKNSQAVINGFA